MVLTNWLHRAGQTVLGVSPSLCSCDVHTCGPGFRGKTRLVLKSEFA